MTDATSIRPMKTWEILNTARKMPAIGTQWLLKLLNIDSERQLQRLCADPKTTESAAPNLIDKYERLLAKLVELGRDNVARSAVARQAHIVGCELRCLDAVEPDGVSLPEECLDDLPKLAAYHRALNDPACQVEEVRAAWQAAKRELDENYELWIRLRHGKECADERSMDRPYLGHSHYIRYRRPCRHHRGCPRAEAGGTERGAGSGAF